ncbi:MAG: SRPBCC domain-containing protein [Pseudonocardiaceae bacterium]|nr:SRPBCC domain-containing protein [Pseudonocardiaceae bacterium]
MTERWRLEKEVELRATPEQVWEAVSTAPGMSTWFVPHEIGEDGQPFGDFGGGNTQGGTILAWEPGRRVVYGAPGSESEESAPFALEFLVEGREGGTTVLRLVQSGFFDGESWEDEYEGTSKGWAIFFHNLAQYFEFFAGLPVTGVVAMSITTLDTETLWAMFYRELGVPAAVAVGDRVKLTPTGLDAISGVVDIRGDGVLGVRTDNALYRFSGRAAYGHGMVQATHYFYGVDMDRAEATAAWQGWLERLFVAQPG